MKSVLILTTILLATEACIKIKFNDEEKNKDSVGVWEDMTSPLHVTESCECGRRPNGDLPWNVFIHLKKVNDSRTRNHRICTGTIIASNLVLTTHKCLTLNNANINFYDIFKPKSENSQRNMIYSVGEIQVTQYLDISNPGKVFPVQDIIYNSHYAFVSTFEKPPVDDVVILKVSADFTSATSKLRPICIPNEEAFKDVNLFESRGVYYGAGSSPGFPIRNAKSLELQIYYPLGDECSAEYKDKNGVVLTADKKRLCSWSATNIGCSPKTWGSPLLVSPERVSYLVGLAIDIISDEYEYYERVYFTNVLAIVKYLEHHANIHKSKWCKAPSKQIDLSKHNFPEGQVFGKANWPPFGTYPWDDPSNYYSREESLGCKCGIANSKNASGRIAGGVKVIPYEFPWMVALTMTELSGGQFSCGGTIINDRLILTAAHCVVDGERVYREFLEILILAKNIKAIVNTHKFEDDKKSKRVKVKKVHIHPNYQQSVKEECYDGINDIALLETEKSLPFSDVYPARPICLPNPTEYFPVVGKIAMAAGWGYTNPDTEVSPKDLRKVQLPILNYSYYCEQFGYGSYPTHGVNPAEIPILCAGYLNRFFDTAPGDSGGPLKIYDEEKGHWTQVGIVSLGIDGDIPEALPDPNFAPKDYATAAIYEDVQRYQKFIDYHSNLAGAKWCKSG